jgi:hypothetical protein
MDLGFANSMRMLMHIQIDAFLILFSRKRKGIFAFHIIEKIEVVTRLLRGLHSDITGSEISEHPRLQAEHP